MNAVSSPGDAILADPVMPGRDHIRGAVDAPVTLLEYGDYECGFCAAAHRIVATIEAAFGSRLRFVFRHFPLTTVHPHAQLAAEAAEAAGAQNEFWAMHGILFRNQRDLRPESLAQYARDLVRLDAAAFAWFEAMPGWAVAAWAVGVWVSLLGAILLLLRSRHAATAFLVSLIGAAGSFVYQFTSDRPASLEGVGNTVMPVVILIAIVLQWYYARRMAAAGVLR